VILPFRISATRQAMTRASARSCVMYTVDASSALCRFFSSAIKSVFSSASRLDIGCKNVHTQQSGHAELRIPPFVQAPAEWRPFNRRHGWPLLFWLQFFQQKADPLGEFVTSLAVIFNCR